MELLPQAEQLRYDHHSRMEDYHRRLETLEGNLLKSRFVAVGDGDSAFDNGYQVQDGAPPPTFAELHPALAAELDAQRRQREHEEMMAKLPVDPTLPPGSRVIAIHRVRDEEFHRFSGEDFGQQLPALADGINGTEFAMPEKEWQPPQVDKMRGKIVQSNAIMLPSPLHGPGPEGTYALTHPPGAAWAHMNLLDGKRQNPTIQATWSKPADFFDSRKFPSAVKYTENLTDDKGERVVSTTWRAADAPLPVPRGPSLRNEKWERTAAAIFSQAIPA